MIKALIADDEPLAREGLRLLLANEPDITVCCECSDGPAVLDAITALKPDLVFLDIDMPGMTGIEVVGAIGTVAMPRVIFLTAYEQYAVEAFTLNALDYLLKPVSTARFRESLRRAREALQLQSPLGQREPLDRMLDQYASRLARERPERLMIRINSHVLFLNPAEIRWIEAEGDYVMMHLINRKHLVRDTMKQMEERLEPYGFQRIHRSSLVNLAFVRELIADANGDYMAVLLDDHRLRLSRAYKEKVVERMQQRVPAPAG